MIICFVIFIIIFRERCYICIYFLPVGKAKHGNELLKLWHKKLYIISIFSLKIFIVISAFCDAFLLLNLLCSFTISSYEMKLKLKVKLQSFFIRSVIAFFWRFISTSLKLFSVKFGTFFSVIIPKLLTILAKYSLNIFATLVPYQ